jgi:hypothetical protein
MLPPGGRTWQLIYPNFVLIGFDKIWKQKNVILTTIGCIMAPYLSIKRSSQTAAIKEIVKFQRMGKKQFYK